MDSTPEHNEKPEKHLLLLDIWPVLAQQASNQSKIHHRYSLQNDPDT